MKIKYAYQARPIRFLEILQYEGWSIKLYSISVRNELVSDSDLIYCKSEIPNWLKKSELYNLDTYKVATLIIHEGREGCFAIINWWIDENMLQNFVYLRRNGKTDFELFSDKGITTCVWEMAVLWHERNAWVKHILSKYQKPDFEAYLNDQLNAD